MKIGMCVKANENILRGVNDNVTFSVIVLYVNMHCIFQSSLTAVESCICPCITASEVGKCQKERRNHISVPWSFSFQSGEDPSKILKTFQKSQRVFYFISQLEKQEESSIPRWNEKVFIFNCKQYSTMEYIASLMLLPVVNGSEDKNRRCWEGSWPEDNIFLSSLEKLVQLL